MFGLFKKKYKLYAPVKGKVIPLKEVPDEVFAQGMAGDGAAIDSVGDLICAPEDGMLKVVFRTNHAFAMELDNGVELLVHIGLDTVKLGGEGFERLVDEGTRVKKGTPIIKIDREFIKSKGCPLIIPVLITNKDIVSSIEALAGQEVQGSEDAMLSYKMV